MQHVVDSIYLNVSGGIVTVNQFQLQGKCIVLSEDEPNRKITNLPEQGNETVDWHFVDVA